MPDQGYFAVEPGIPLLEGSVDAVALGAHRLDDMLAIGAALV